MNSFSQHYSSREFNVLLKFTPYKNKCEQCVQTKCINMCKEWKLDVISNAHLTKKGPLCLD